jgi:hypothetical protein
VTLAGQTGTRAARARRIPVQSAASLLGGGFLVLGVLGFVPGVTTDFVRLELYGAWSEAMLFGTFQVSVLANLVHLGFGVAGLRSGSNVSSARSYLLGGGAFYLLVWCYGLVVRDGSPANILPAGQAGAWLHLVIGTVMTTLAVVSPRLPGGAAHHSRRRPHRG